MSSVKQVICEALLSEVQRYNPRAVEVIDFEDDVEVSGYCETCYYEEHGLNVKYVDEDGATNSIFISISLADFIRGLG